MRRSLIDTVNSDPRLLTVGGFKDIPSASEHLSRLTPEIVILDIGPSGIRGGDAVARIREILPEAKIMIFALSGDCDDLFASLYAGADGYLLKRSSPADLIKAIVVMHEGGFPMAPEVSRKMVDNFRLTAAADPAAKEEKLTRRQSEILEKLSKGMSAKEIANQLGLSVLTVRFHIRITYKKLKVSSQTQALLKYMERSSTRRSPDASRD